HPRVDPETAGRGDRAARPEAPDPARGGHRLRRAGRAGRGLGPAARAPRPAGRRADGPQADVLQPGAGRGRAGPAPVARAGGVARVRGVVLPQRQGHAPGRDDQGRRLMAVLTPPDLVPAARAALERGRDRLVADQDPGGWWWAELESNATIVAEHVFL